MEFCNRLINRTGKEYRLPSEAEWEYACRGGTTTPYSFGEKPKSTMANFDTVGTTDVGRYPANALGLHDMHGNVYEWCYDYWNDSYEGAPSDGSAWRISRDGYPRIVIRGSTCGEGMFDDFRSTYRSFSTSLSCLIGFRVSCSAPRT